MNIINTLKDLITLLQKTDNIDMVQKVIDIQSQIMEMQVEISKLQEENKKLKDTSKIRKNIIRHENDNVIHLKNEEKILYCSKCWDDEQKLIQVSKTSSRYQCPKCNDIKYFLGKEPNYESNGEKITII